MKSQWLSVHLYSAVDLDLILLHIVRPFLAQYFAPSSGDCFFFIRYWDEGSHIRLRMKVPPMMGPVLLSALNQQIRSVPSLGCRLKAVAYEPEIDRYGDVDTIHFAEHYFFLSSRYILAHIVPKPQRGSPLTAAIELQLILLKALGWEIPQLCQLLDHFIAGWIRRLFDPLQDPEEEHRFWSAQFEKNFSRKAAAFRSTIAQLWSDLDRKDKPDDRTDFLTTSAQLLRTYMAAVDHPQKRIAICASLIHMNNNRVGLSNLDEAYASYCLRHSLHTILSSQKP